MTKKYSSTTPASHRTERDRRLVVRGERRTDPDWDRFLAALIALALRQVEETEGKEDRE